MWLSPYLAIEKKAGCSKSNDITKYFSITPQPLGRKSLISEQAKEKPKMVPCHIGGSSDEVPLSVSRSTSRLHRFKQNRYPEARTSLIKDSSCSDPPNNVKVISESNCSSADTAFRGRAVMGSVDLAQVTGRCHGARVGLGSGQSEIACTLTIQAAVQSASGTTRVSDEKVATIFTRKRDTNKANSPQHSERWILNWCSRSTLKHNQTERKGSITSGWRDKLSGSARKGSLEEVKLSNPLFPVRRVFTMLLKKYKHKILESESPETEIGATSPSSVGKRKHQNEKEDPETVRKRQRSSPGLEETSLTGYSPSLEDQVRGSLIPSSRGQPRRSRLSRTQRLRRQQQESQGLGIGHELTPNPPNQAESPQKVYPAQPQQCLRRVHNIEDLLWTEKYRPQHSSEVIGNSASVKKLHSWLKNWKRRADCEERRKERDRKLEENANSNDSWDCGDFQGEARVGEEDLCSTMLITGPPGVGKTASVYACAQELGFKVFEVNASSQRSGRHILTQLKEATQSHLVEIQGSTTFKPSHLSSYNNTSTKSDTVAVFVSLKTVKKADIINPPLVSQLSPDIEEPPTGSRSKRMSTSLILFEEVDVVFDDDVGFLTAIKTFMTTTKRPVILTTSDPSFKAKFDGDFEAILFKNPSVVNVCSYLQLLCLAENVRMDAGDITSLVSLNQIDIRRSLLQLQLWACSGGGQASQRATPLKDPAGGVHGTLDVAAVEDIAVGENTSSRHPPYDVGCTQSMLGLLNSGPSHDLQTTLKCQSWAKPDIIKLMEILTESWRRGVALLYLNLELLLPLPVRTQPSPLLTPKKVTCPRLQSEPTPPDIHHPQISPVKVSFGSRLRRKKCVPTSDSRSAHSMLVKPYRASLSVRRAHPSVSTITETINDKLQTEKAADGLVYHCLDAITDFMDLMSFIDTSLPSESSHKAGPCRPGSFLWTGAEVKDGLLDEMREEDGGCRWWCERTLEIQAAVEGLGFHRCLARVSEGWAGSQRLEGEQRGRVMEKLTLPLAPPRQSFNVSQTTSCDPSVVERRYDIIRTVLSSRAFCTLGNKQAVALDYLPVLRTMCQSERTQQGQGSSIHLGLPKATVRLLADDFP
ncbi:ATPase family AAA domain-containing protein 5-like isoform X3 [Salvelinus namaycush]|uniref:ATPase family AAA domain-containing protein 5-like isoform X3 n=1 Tax=Salvelinus namaycush TaxID=8040 RepID=A0A8U1FCQ0_SALNM|nr:ATPase family AAA domain-containing protein 5-like isoform X3 [Salvelinus namaycush]